MTLHSYHWSALFKNVDDILYAGRQAAIDSVFMTNTAPITLEIALERRLFALTTDLTAMIKQSVHEHRADK